MFDNQSRTFDVALPFEREGRFMRIEDRLVTVARLIVRGLVLRAYLISCERDRI